MARANVRVRPATVDDVDGLVALLATVDLSRGTFSGLPLGVDQDTLGLRLTEIIRDDCPDARALTVAADESTGVILGLLVTRADQVGAVTLTPVLHITHLLVSPKCRRRGVGRALLACAVHLADHGDYSHVVASVATNSREANRYLARLGFAPLVTHRISTTHALHKALGIGDSAEGLAAVRRGRLLRARAGRTDPALRANRIARGA